ncbi:MAG: hypothetical protein C0518_05570 [Opitutus sp.]|nr:hypothetical protein [Opitutus sp.]
MSAPDLSLAIRSQEAIAAYLKSRQRFAGVTILARRRGIIQNDIDAAVGEMGAILYVLPGKPVKVNPNNPGPHAEQYEIRVRAIENPALNETQPTAYELYEGALIELSHLTITGLEVLGMIYPAEQNGDETPDPERIIIDAIFYANAQLPPRPGL